MAPLLSYTCWHYNNIQDIHVFWCCLRFFKSRKTEKLTFVILKNRCYACWCWSLINAYDFGLVFRVATAIFTTLSGLFLNIQRFLSLSLSHSACDCESVCYISDSYNYTSECNSTHFLCHTTAQRNHWYHFLCAQASKTARCSAVYAGTQKPPLRMRAKLRFAKNL